MIPGTSQIIGFKHFISMWFDATDQILTKNTINLDTFKNLTQKMLQKLQKNNIKLK